jgi:hypothetical protein
MTEVCQIPKTQEFSSIQYLTPHPIPLPCLRRSGFAQAGARGEGKMRDEVYGCLGKRDAYSIEASYCGIL